MTSTKGILREVIQFFPILVLASSFVIGGSVDPGRALPLFVVASLLAVIITYFLAAQRIQLNPVLVGTNLWLCIGALGFGVPILSPLAELVGDVQAFGLYLCLLATGIAMTVFSRGGYIGFEHEDPNLVRKLSFAMLVLTALAAVWAFVFIDNIRLGGALPFIALNLIRRLLIRKSNSLSQILAQAPPGIDRSLRN